MRERSHTYSRGTHQRTRTGTRALTRTRVRTHARTHARTHEHARTHTHTHTQVPHLLSDEASCYYHGYVLAEMAVSAATRTASWLVWGGGGGYVLAEMAVSAVN